ncbi:hypothetical protein ACFSX1_31610, partial [Micromonospora eburnea]
MINTVPDGSNPPNPPPLAGTGCAGNRDNRGLNTTPPRTATCDSPPANTPDNTRQPTTPPSPS